jgi:hypothetical protein
MQANTEGYDPQLDPDKKVAPERRAAFRVFLHVECILALPTVKQQVARIPNADLRNLHQGFHLVHLEEPLLDVSAVAARADELEPHHGGREGAAEDCQIVAEAELAGATVLLTFDETLRKRLGLRARLPLLSPSEYWVKLAISRGALPVREPAMAHPLSGATWWRW